MNNKEFNIYLLGSMWDKIDKTSEFIENGIWENGYNDNRYNEIINNIHVGDLIALKSSYTKSKNLPFNNNGKAVSVMKIKTIGKVSKNPKNGKILHIDYQKNYKAKEIYGCSYRKTINKINKDNWDEEFKWIFQNKKQSHYYSYSNKDIKMQNTKNKNG